MLSLIELQCFLAEKNCCFEILKHESPILSAKDADKYFDVHHAAPTLIMDTEKGMLAFIVSASRGKLNIPVIKNKLGFARLSMADREKISTITGYRSGVIPLVGHNLPCVFDTRLLEKDYIYGGTGDPFHTLKIVPQDVVRLNIVTTYLDA